MRKYNIGQPRVGERRAWTVFHRSPFFYLLFMLLLVTFSRAQNTSNADSAAHSKTVLAAQYGKLPLAFESNEGQTDRRVRFLSRGSGYSLFLTDTEAVLTLRRP